MGNDVNGVEGMDSRRRRTCSRLGGRNDDSVGPEPSLLPSRDRGCYKVNVGGRITLTLALFHQGRGDV